MKNVALAVAAVIVALLVAEAVLTVVDYPAAYTDHQQLFVEYDSVRGWRNIPNAHRRYVTPDYVVQLDYNAHSYRGPLIDYAKPTGIHRVLLLGDSFVEGYSVPLAQRAGEVLEQLQPGVQTISLGTGGYSTDQELLWLESEGLRYAPDLVVVLFCTNDVWYNNRATYPRGAKPLFRVAHDSLVLTHVPVPRAAFSSGPGRHSLRAFISAHSHLLRLWRRARLHSPGVLPGGLPALSEEFLPFAPTPTPAPAADSAWRVTAQLLGQMQRLVRRGGGQLAVMLIPATEALYPPGALRSRRFSRASPFGGPSLASARFAALCARAQVRCIDPTARFIAAADSLAQHDEMLIFGEDDHWNAHGHRVAAAVLAEIVRSATRPPASWSPRQTSSP